MTLTREPRAPDRLDDLLERDTAVEPPPAMRESRIRWFEWAIGAAVIALIALSATLLMPQTTEPEAESTLVLGSRQIGGIAYVPEFVGASGGDLPAIESSQLLIGTRHLDGVVYVPEYVGQSGGDLPVVESSPLVLGPRQIGGVVYVPEFVGHADGIYPESTR